jgi:YHS domain-containing protein
MDIYINAVRPIRRSIMKRDPVCKKKVEGDKHKTAFRGKDYCFCSKDCKEKFEKSPSSYAVIDDSEMPA